MTQTLPSKLFSRPACGACLLLFTLIGCQSSNHPATQPAYKIIRRGHPPMSVVVTVPGRLQVVNLSDNQNNPIEKIILDTKISANSIITLNAGSGVTINAKPVKAKGPFSFKHTYEFRFYQQ